MKERRLLGVKGVFVVIYDGNDNGSLSSVFSSSHFFVCLLCFSPSPLCFSFLFLFLCFFLLLFRLCVSFLPCIYRGEKETYTPSSQWHKGVGWMGRPLFSRPFTTLRTPRVLDRHLFGSSGEEKSVRNRGRQKSSSSPASRVQGKKKTHNAFKTTPFRAPLFLKE